jgi:hypothetical protein
VIIGEIQPSNEEEERISRLRDGAGHPTTAPAPPAPRP